MKIRSRTRVLTWIAPLFIASAFAVAQDHSADTAQQVEEAVLDEFDDHGAAAAHGEEAAANPMSWNWVPYVSSLVVFGAAFFILNKTAWPKISQGLADRENKIKGDIAQAEKARSDAEAALAAYNQSLSEARAEAGKILEQAKVDHQKVAAEMRTKTEAELNAMRDSARRDIEMAKKQAVGEVYEHMAHVATSIAGKILQKEISADDQKSLVDDSLNQLAGTGSN